MPVSLDAAVILSKYATISPLGLMATTGLRPYGLRVVPISIVYPRTFLQRPHLLLCIEVQTFVSALSVDIAAYDCSYSDGIGPAEGSVNLINPYSHS